MDFTDLTLVVPEKSDVERESVCDAWKACGGSVVRLGRFWVPPEGLASDTLRLYGNAIFCLVLAQKLGLSLLSPPDNLHESVPSEWLGRKIEMVTLASAREREFPSFIKPVIPKQFSARVYNSAAELDGQCRGLDPSVKVLRSSIVNFQAEARSFILRGKIQDCAIYEGYADHKAAESFIGLFCSSVALPETCVVDVGLIDGGGWAFIEANPSWGAGLNGCDASRVLPAIERATRKDGPV